MSSYDQTASLRATKLVAGSLASIVLGFQLVYGLINLGSSLFAETAEAAPLGEVQLAAVRMLLVVSCVVLAAALAAGLRKGGAAYQARTQGRQTRRGASRQQQLAPWLSLLLGLATLAILGGAVYQSTIVFQAQFATQGWAAFSEAQRTLAQATFVGLVVLFAATLLMGVAGRATLA